VFSKKYLFLFIIVLVLSGVILPFILLKDAYPFHRFGMFAEPIKHQAQNEKFYIFYTLDKTHFIELKPQTIPINANAFEMQLRKHHYQKKHADFISVFDKIIKNKMNLKEDLNKDLKWKWYHVTQNENLQNELDSLCVFYN
jgi:hypothetical protein